ncbi:MAG: outer membrane beta-barrel protein, partial [Bacteroidota bacterium]
MCTPITCRLLAIAMLFLMFLTGLRAQNQINGTIIDENSVPLSYAGVMLLQAADSLLIKGEVSDDEGRFSFADIPAGEYLVGISMISYDDLFTASFTLDADSQEELGTLQLLPGATDLAEVEVVAKKPLFEQRIDRLVVNVAQSVTSAGSTALEVLERSPGVVVNRQANDISISGRSGVVVMINNKISRLPIDAIIQQLEAMPADNVERIEVITTPPANFDAEGNAGIISIILRKNLAEGLNGTANVSAGYGFHEKWGGNINFNYRKGKWNVFGDYGTDYNETYQEFTSYRGFTNAAGNFIENDNVSDRDPIQKNQNARLGIDFQLTDRTVVGVLGSWSERNWQMDAVNTVDRSENNQLIDRLVIDNDEGNIWNNWLANVNVQHELNNNGRLNFDLDYTRYDNTNPSNYVNNFFNPDGDLIDQTALRVRKDTPIDIYVFKADYSQDLSEDLKLEAGVKGNFSAFGNDFSVENLEEDLWVSD